MLDNIWFIAAVWMDSRCCDLISIEPEFQSRDDRGWRSGWPIRSRLRRRPLQVGIAQRKRQCRYLHTYCIHRMDHFLALLGSGILTFLAGAEIDLSRSKPIGA